ncbi:hypothetical protein [Endozoicomonas sp.]|uniref:hypothetical protein n=1 Tax=Endozoicomonas sp. TaxID=1892382 RepID=UPI003AF5D085
MEKRLTFKRLKRLTGTARRRFRTVMDWCPDEEIKAAKAQLWSVNRNALLLLTRIEKKELVIVCAVGRELIDACVYLLAAAKMQGLQSIRFHTLKPAFVRLIQRHFPFQLIDIKQGGERVLRMVIHG